MASTSKTVSFKEVLRAHPRGEPLGTAALKRLGVTPFRASALARSGWLDHLARGVYMLPGDTLSRDGSLAFLAEQIPGLHVGSKTALAWRGVRQNIAFRETLSLWGERAKPLPSWFTQRFQARYQTTQLFDATMPSGTGLQPLPNGDARVLVSVPERALLELLSDLGKTQSLSEARDLVEGLPNLRPKVLDELLTHTTRVKVVWAAASLAAELKLPWVSVAKQHSLRFSGGVRWIAVSKTGERLDFKKP